MFDKEFIPDLKNAVNGQRTVIQEGESLVVEGQFVDGDGAAVTETAIQSFTLTLYDEATGSIINSRNAVNILDANDGTVSVSGAFTFRLGASDSAIINTYKATGDLESHIIRLNWTWNDGTVDLAGIDEFRIFVSKLASPA